jgi:hypothetical protein
LSVFNPPKVKILNLPAPKDGARFQSARVLNGAGADARLTQTDAGVAITISGEWDPVLTAIRLERKGR